MRRVRHGGAWLALVCGAIALLECLPARAVEINVRTVSCQRYQDSILHPQDSDPASAVDPIDTTMWLLGFAVGELGDHAMYGDALQSYGYALDAECRNNPGETLLHAVTAVQIKHDSPMDLQQVTCGSWSTKHTDLKRRDAESANTLTMWLYGYSAARNQVQTLQTDALPTFESALVGYCDSHANSTLFDALIQIKPPGAPSDKPPRPPRARRAPGAAAAPGAPSH